jgi:hypothetical protein
MSNRTNPRKTAGRLVIDTFKAAKAFSPKTAQSSEICKDLPLSTNVIAYTITNMMKDGILVNTEGDKFYFSQKNWDKFQKGFNRIYWMIIGIPAGVAILLYFIQALGFLK